MGALDDLIAFNIGRKLAGGSTASEREQDRLQRERHHKELLAALEGRPIQARPQPRAQYVPTPADIKRGEKYARDAQNAVRWCRGWFSKKNIISVDLKTEVSSYPFRVKLPQIGTKIRAREPFMRLDIGSVNGMEVSIPFDGVIIERNQQAVDDRAYTQKGFWLVKIRLANRPQELKVSCPHCEGHISFSVAEYGGKTIACPHCQNSTVLPNE